METLREVVNWAMRQEFAEPLRIVSGERWKLEQLWIYPPFQVERVTLLPNTAIVLHRHPNVDSWEYAICGSGVLKVGWRKHQITPQTKRLPLHIPRTAWHGGWSGENGACWLSIQEWFCELSSIDTDWETAEIPQRNKFANECDAALSQ